jgi:hypothetical protein
MYNGYTSVYGRHFNSSKCREVRGFTENFDQHQKLFYPKANIALDSQFLSLSPRSPMSDEYYSSSELMSWDAELLHNKTQYSLPIGSDIELSTVYDSLDCTSSLAAYTLNTGWLAQGEQLAAIPQRCQDQFLNELSLECIPQEYRRVGLPSSTDKWSPPPSPIFQASPSPIEDAFFQSVLLNSIHKRRTIFGSEPGSEIVEKTFDESKDGSFLFVTTSNVEEMKAVFHEHGLEFQDIGKTRRHGVLVVLFKSHAFAKRAFTTQKKIGIRMVPPRLTRKYWFKNPGPKFHVVFVTTRRLTVKCGKSCSSVSVGDFLMADSRQGRGCTVLADQMKGHRLRVVDYLGKFMHTDGRVIEKKSLSEPKLVGWISTQCHKSKEKFVVRVSMNEIEDYLHYDRVQAVE